MDDAAEGGANGREGGEVAKDEAEELEEGVKLPPSKGWRW
jgi:hypothetical protein